MKDYNIFNYIYPFPIFSSLLFFLIPPIIGFNYGGKDDSTLFVTYNVTVFVVSILVFVAKDIHDGITGKEVMTLLFVGLYIVSGLILGNPNAIKMIPLVVPSILVAMHYARHPDMRDFLRLLSPVVPLLGIGLLFGTRTMLMGIADGTVIYSQELSYQSAIVYLLTLYIMFYGKHLYRPSSFYQSTIYKTILALVLVECVIIGLISGGRGGFLEIMVISILFYLTGHIKIGYFLKRRFVHALIAAIILLIFFWDKIIRIMSMIIRGSERVFNYMTSGGINVEAYSDREEIMVDVYKYIYDSPLLGNGIWGYLNLTNSYPHNFFVEVLLQGGLIFLTVWLGILVNLYGKMKRCYKRDHSLLLIIMLFVYAFVELQFSATYTQQGYFWFGLIFFFNIKISKTGKIE